jgi:D-glycero-D-manno-heptose 1,7-bisphosphate phosphatase
VHFLADPLVRNAPARPRRGLGQRRRRRRGWIDGADQAIPLPNDVEFLVFIVRNQAGIAKHYYTEEDLLSLDAQLATELAALGADNDNTRYFPFHPDAAVAKYRRVSHSRKRARGMIARISCGAGRWIAPQAS